MSESLPSPDKSHRSRTLMALDAMIESVREDLRENDPGNHATIGALNGELKGLMAARTYVELDSVRSHEPRIDGWCPTCKGSGSMKGMTSGLGPDDHEIDVDCKTCGGTGAGTIPSTTAPSPTWYSKDTLLASLDRHHETFIKGTGRDPANYSSVYSEAATFIRDLTSTPSATACSTDAKDAARYRWLRDLSVPPHNFYIAVPDEFKDERYAPQQVDAAIDAAMRRPDGGKA